MSDAPRLLDLKGPPEVGKTYLVPVCDLNGIIQRRAPLTGKAVPVLGVLHNDNDTTGVDIDHLHVDSRFITNDELIDCAFNKSHVHGQNANGLAINCALLDGEQPKVWEEPRVCVSDVMPQPYGWLVDGMQGTRLDLRAEGFKLKPDCKVCPHKGTHLDNVKVVNGQIQCPAHGLRFDAQNLEVV